MEWNIVADSGCDLRGIKLGDKEDKNNENTVFYLCRKYRIYGQSQV